MTARMRLYVLLMDGQFASHGDGSDEKIVLVSPSWNLVASKANHMCRDNTTRGLKILQTDTMHMWSWASYGQAMWYLYDGVKSWRVGTNADKATTAVDQLLMISESLLREELTQIAEEIMNMIPSGSS